MKQELIESELKYINGKVNVCILLTLLILLLGGSLCIYINNNIPHKVCINELVYVDSPEARDYAFNNGLYCLDKFDENGNVIKYMSECPIRYERCYFKWSNTALNVE